MLKRIFTTFRGSRKRDSYKAARKSVAGWRRCLQHEQLENRCMLATLTVNITADTVPTNDGNLSLREAIAIPEKNCGLTPLRMICSGLEDLFHGGDS